MQWRDSTNKSPKYLNAVENKFDIGEGKTPPGEFKVTTPENPLLSITSNK